MEKRNGLDYLNLKIGNSGVIPTSQSGFGYQPLPKGFRISDWEYKNRNQNPYLGNLIDEYDNLLGTDLSTDSTFSEVQDSLYNNQTTEEALSNAATSMLTITGTTFVSNTVGLIASLFEGTWDNAVNKKMAEYEDEARKKYKIYRPSDYENWSLGDKLSNQVFWADLVQNSGYTLGSGLATAAWSVATGGFGGILSKAPKIVQSAAGGLIGAFGEASMEAVHYKNEEIQRNQQLARQNYLKLLSNVTSPEEEQLLTEEYYDTLSQIEQDAISGGNFVFGTNTAFLTLSNAIQFGDFYARGFSTGRRVDNALKRTLGSVASEVVEDGTTQLGKQSLKEAFAKGAGKTLINAFTEAGEESGQYILSKAAALNSEYNSFNNSKFNPEKREEVTGIWNSLITSYAEAMHDNQFATEAAMGFITGLVGMPTLKKSYIPVRMEGGIIGEMRSALSERKEFNKAIDNINSRLQNNEELNNYYEGLVRHLHYTDKENLAIKSNDHREFANANSAKFISDIIMFDKVGRLDLLENIINTASNLNEEQYNSLVENTEKENGEGAFIKNGNPISYEEAQGILKDKAKILKQKIKTYNKIKDKLIRNYDSLNEDSLDEALYHYIQAEDASQRGKQMKKQLYELVKSFALKEDNIPPAKKQFSQNLTEEVRNLNEDNIIEALSNNQNSLADKLTIASIAPEYGITLDMIDEFNTLTKDIKKVMEDYSSHTTSFNNIITNPIQNNEKNNKFREKLKRKSETKERKKQNEEKEKLVQETPIGNLSSQFLEGDLDADELNSAMMELHNDPNLEEMKKVQQAQKMAQVTRNQVGTISTPGIIDNTSGTEQGKQDAKSFFVYANKHADSAETILDESTYVEMDEAQIAEALGIDLSTFNGEELENKLAEIQERKAQALAVLSESLEKGIQDMEESSGMSAEIRTPDEIEQIGKDPITPVQSNSSKKIVNNPVSQPKQVATENNFSESKQETNNWTSGLSYRYFGKTEDYGKEHLLVLKKHIEELTKKENSGTISNEEKSLLKKYKEDFATLRFMINQNVFSVARQKLVQPGTKLNFLIPAEFPTAVFLSVTGTDGLQYIVGNVIKSNIVVDVLARRTQKQEVGDYVEYNVSTVKEKKIGSLAIIPQQVHLQKFSKDFTLGIDLSTQGSSIADVRTLPNSEVGNKTEEEESIRQPIKSNGGNAYVLVETSNPETKYITANIVSDTYVQEQSDAEETANTTVTPASYLQQVVSSQASIQEKLAEIQEILDVDIRILQEVEDLETHAKKIVCKVTSKGTWENKNTRTVYGELTATPENLPQEILNLVSGRAKYTVSRKYMNSTIGNIDYNQMMSSVLTTNLGSLETIGDWFTMEPISHKSKISSIEQVKRTPTVAMATTENKTIVESQGVNYFVDTTSWNVYEDRNGKRTLISPTSYNEDIYKALADALLSKQGKALGLHTTPWGVYNSKDRSFLRGISSLDLQTLAPILSGLSSNRASEKIHALILYDTTIPTSKKTKELDAYVETIDQEIYKQRYSYDTKNILQHQWESGNRDHIEVASTIQDDTLEPGVEIIDTVIQPSIYRGQSVEDVHPTLLQKAKVVIRKNTIQASPKQETTTIPLNIENNPILQKIDKLGFLYVFNDLESGRQKKLLEFFGDKNFRIVDRVIRNEMTKLSTMDVFDKAAYVDSLTLDEPPFRKTNTQHTKILDLEKELSWLHKVLPQTKTEDRVRILKGLIKVANSNDSETAWGMLKNGIIYIVENSAEGTVYHEAFHFVTHILMTKEELNTLYDEAKKQYKIDNISELEELLAEDFRRYITYDITENKGILKTLWKNIKQWLKNIFGNINYIEKVYRDINNGVYAHRILKESLETKYRKLKENESLQTESPEVLTKIKNAHTIYKEENEELKEKLRKMGSNRTYTLDKTHEFISFSPHGKELVYIKEDRGKYKILFYSDKATLQEVKLEESIREEIDSYTSNSEKARPQRMSYQEYVNELAYLEEQIAKLTEEEKNFTEEGYEYQYFKERERQVELSLEFQNLTEEEKQAITQLGVSQNQYDALSTSEKFVLFHCLGI